MSDLIVCRADPRLFNKLDGMYVSTSGPIASQKKQAACVRPDPSHVAVFAMQPNGAVSGLFSLRRQCHPIPSPVKPIQAAQVHLNPSGRSGATGRVKIR